MSKRKIYNDPKDVPTPEIEKMHAVKTQSQAIGAFLDWLTGEHGWELAYWDEHSLQLAHYSIEKLLAEYFRIDLQKVDDEKRAILAAIRRKDELSSLPAL